MNELMAAAAEQELWEQVNRLFPDPFNHIAEVKKRFSEIEYWLLDQPTDVCESYRQAMLTILHKVEDDATRYQRIRAIVAARNELPKPPT